MAAAVALVCGLVAQGGIAHADLLSDLLNQSNSNPDANKVLADVKKTTPASSGGSTTSSTTTSDTAATTTTDTAAGPGTGTTVAAPAVIPPSTPLIVDTYSTDPALLQSGSKFSLSVTVKNPGASDAENVVVQIGPSAATSWGSSDELVVLGSGSAKYVGSITAGETNDSASFDLLANPTSPGGPRSIPVKITWQSGGYEYTSNQVIGILVNSMVGLDTTMSPTQAQAQKLPFGVVVRIANTTKRTVKGVCVVFSGKGARPSSAATVTVGDLPGGAVKTVVMKYTAPLVGRAKLMATVAYADDFGAERTVSCQGWARVQRGLPVRRHSVTVVQRVVSVLVALLGLGGNG